MAQTQFVKPRILAEMLGMSVETIRRWCRSGEIRTVTTPGGSILIPRSEVDRLVAVPTHAA